MNHCSTNACRQGRELCPTPMTCSGAGEETDAALRVYRAMHAPLSIDYAEDEPMPSPEQAMHGTEIALCWIAAGVAAFVLAWAVYVNWPLFVAAVK